MPYIRCMGGTHPAHHFNPQRTMIYGFPFITDHQLIVNMANSAKETIRCLEHTETRTTAIDEQFAKRVHELMHFRSHTVDTDGF